MPRSQRRRRMQILFHAIMALIVLLPQLVQADNCGQLTLQSKANLYADLEADQALGMFYPAGLSLQIADIEGGMARVTWPARNGNPGGEAYLRSSSFNNEDFVTASRRCSVATSTPFFEPTANKSVHKAKGLVDVKINTQDEFSCLPAMVKNKLNEMQAMGWQITLMSAHRSKKDNARRGGARHSMHIQCRAADFLVSGVPISQVREYLVSSWTGGLGLYCSGRIHIDNGNHRMWGSMGDNCNAKEKAQYRDMRIRYYSKNRGQSGPSKASLR